jgi:hypothetical protein
VLSVAERQADLLQQAVAYLQQISEKTEDGGNGDGVFGD